MIIKSFEAKKINLNSYPYLLLHGKNEGLKSETIIELLKNKKNKFRYDEKEILEQPEIFLESIFSKSLFDNEKIIIINRATDKILKILSEITNKRIEDIIVIINADYLEKKSKLRDFFEKQKNCVCIPFYPDNHQTLNKIAIDFFNKKDLKISSSNMNILINRSNGDRNTLITELQKLEFYMKNGKKITTEKMAKLINLIENHEISELVNSCLIKNKRKTINILSENNYSNEDCILIIRSLINQIKKLLKLSDTYSKNGNIELTISSAKPPIFWKDKEITKKQIIKWEPKQLKNLIYKLNNLELFVKVNFENSLNLITDFILNQILVEFNNEI